MLMCLGTGNPVSGILWEGLGGLALVESVGSGFEISKDPSHSPGALCLLLVDEV